MAAANITGCGVDNDMETAALIVKDSAATVLAVGDLTSTGTLEDLETCYGPSWGQFKARTYPVIGNHEAGMLDSTVQYFGDRVPAEGKTTGYYSFELGTWHVVVLNDNLVAAGGAPLANQMTWLAADLAAHANKCVMATFHEPLFYSSNTGSTERPGRRAFWTALDGAGVDVVINGHQHNYERMAAMKPDGTRDSIAGIRQFNVGTGGESLDAALTTIHPNSEVRLTRYGVLRMELDTLGYKWAFLPDDGTAAADSGTATCR
jgi:predicted phosphodiesterase